MIIVKGMLLFEFGNWMISKPNIKIFLQSKRQFTFYWCQLFFIIFTVFNGFVRKNYWNINRHYSTLLWSYLTLIGFSRWILKRSDLNFRWLFEVVWYLLIRSKYSQVESFPDNVIQSGINQRIISVRYRILTGKQLQTPILDIVKSLIQSNRQFFDTFPLDVLENGYNQAKIEPLLVVG